MMLQSMNHHPSSTCSRHCHILTKLSTSTSTSTKLSTAAAAAITPNYTHFSAHSFSTFKRGSRSGSGSGGGKPKEQQQSKNQSKSKSNNNNKARKGGNIRNHQLFPNPKLRTHAISFINGDYSDFTTNFMDENDDEDFDDNNNDNEIVYGKWDIENYKDGDDDDYDDDNNNNKNQDPEKAYQTQLEQQAAQIENEEDAKRIRWRENAKAPVRIPQIDPISGKAYAKGGRKVATARVWVSPGEGMITVNRREFLDYFPRESDRDLILSPFIATNTCGMFDVNVAVEGGGVTGKAGAIRHGIARALQSYNPDYRPPMKRLGYMTRDNRQVERKKVGLKKARKAPQWVRR